jgi:hypothetical protein
VRTVDIGWGDKTFRLRLTNVLFGILVVSILVTLIGCCCRDCWSKLRRR